MGSQQAAAVEWNVRCAPRSVRACVCVGGGMSVRTHHFGGVNYYNYKGLRLAPAIVVYEYNTCREFLPFMKDLSTMKRIYVTCKEESLRDLCILTV
jgi:hypothetical protein